MAIQLNLVHCWTEIEYSKSKAFRQVGLSALSIKTHEVPCGVGSLEKLQVTYCRQSGIKQVQSRGICICIYVYNKKCR
jgi:hypothetical protein